MHEKDIVKRHANRSPIRPVTRGLYLGAAAVIAVAAFVTYYSIETLVETNRRGKHTHEVAYALEQIGLNLAQAEANHRGFLLSSQDDHLERLNRARVHAWSAMARAEALTHDNPAQQARFPIMRGPGSGGRGEPLLVRAEEGVTPCASC